jgi:uncharacterized protein YegP (UPF0339 family)
MASEERLEIRQGDYAGQQRWFWHWLEANNKIIATSGEPFFSKGDAYDAAERIETRLAYRLPIRIIEG